MRYISHIIKLQQFLKTILSIHIIFDEEENDKKSDQ